jgi:hypothetical protein
MRRAFVIAPLIGAAALAGAFLLRSAYLPATEANEKREANAGKSPTAEMLPISQVVLFSSGVGYFQREGQVEGTQRIDLSFPVQDINDLLKSLTLRDLDGGHIATVSYDSNSPIEKTLKTYALNLHNNPSFGQLLNQARGEKVEVVLQQQAASQPGTLSGSLVGVEKQKIAVGKDQTVEVELLNLWCADGLRSVKLSEVQRVRFLNAIMDSELKKALETLALAHDTQKKAVSLQCVGEGKRTVKVGYVVEAPIWKTSYRLVLGTKADEKHQLQGWAIVENAGEEDWREVRMALVSGRPISFQMNLYDQLFLKRPVVEPELFASLRPPAFSGGLGEDGTRVAMEKEKAGKAMDEQLRRKAGEGKEAAPGRGQQQGQDKALKRLEDREEKLDLSQGVQSAAEASKLGDFFQYGIQHSVNLPRQKSALLPILQSPVEAERFSIYNEKTHAKFPLLGLAFKNTSGAHLMQGPITVFDGPSYAGDARILDLQKDERRLLAYAIDLGTEVNAVASSDNGKYTSIKIINGTVHTQTRVKDARNFTIANRNDQDRVLLLEHPNRPDFKFTIQDKPWETASDFHRFKVAAPKGKTVTYTISEEKEFPSQVRLSNSDDHQINVFFNEAVASPAVKEALKSVLERKQKMAETSRTLEKVKVQHKEANDEREQVRRDLQVTPPTSNVHKKSLEKLEGLQTKIDAYQEDIKKLQEQVFQQQKDLDAFLNALSAQ